MINNVRVLVTKNSKIMILASILVLSFIGYFIFNVAYYRPPLGDDVLHQFTTSHDMYYYYGNEILPHGGPLFGEQVTNGRLLIESLVQKYLYHSGRMVGYALIPLLSIFGQFWVAFLTAMSFIGVVWLIVKNAFIEDSPLAHPLFLLATFLTIFYFFPAINFLLMWTFTSVYVVPIFLLLAFVTLLRLILRQDKKHSVTYIILFNVFGIIAGFTHEVFSLVFAGISFLLISTAVFKHKKSARLYFYLPGIIIGSLLTLSAPGNFVRLVGPHDAPGQARSILTKLWESIMIHKYFLPFNSSIKSHLVPLTIFALGVFYYIPQLFRRIRSWTVPVFEDIVVVMAIALVFFWSFFPYVSMYGVFGFICLTTIISFIAIRKSALYSWLRKNKFSQYVTALVVIATLSTLLVTNARWLGTLKNYTRLWQSKISAARLANQTEVYVPKYPDFVSNRFTFFNYNNNSNGEFQTEYYKAFYKINVIPQ